MAPPDTITDMKIAILGFARDGQAAYEYFNNPSNAITICDSDKNIQVPTNTEVQLGEEYLKDLGRFDLLIRSAGLKPSLIKEANPNSPEIFSKVSGNIDEFLKASPSKNIIGVTGTKGKGTTSTLIYKMLIKSGYTAHLGGNIGIAALNLLKNNIKPSDWVVLELGAFQLVDQKISPKIAICLMVEPEHMDWFSDFNEYIQAKQQLFINQSADDIAIYNYLNVNSKNIAEASPANLIPYMNPPGAYVSNEQITIDDQIICDVKDIKLLGRHNHQNICAAVTAVWQITKDKESFKSIITTFSGLDHRIEYVKELSGVKYYDDSFGTTPETAIVAIEAFENPKIVILGGSDKGSKYDKLALTVKNSNVKQIITIGQMGPVIAKALADVGFNDVSEGGTTMEQIVTKSREYTTPGDIVLLSTACASFGMFKDYKDRGDQFKQVVQSLV